MNCCGRSLPRVERPRRRAAPLPPNPPVKSGVAVIFLGAGRVTLTSKQSGLRYAVSDERRHVKIDPRDVAEVLVDRRFMLAP